MRKSINIKRGLNLNLEGALTETRPAERIVPTRVALTPDDFPGFIPRPEQQEGDSVAAGAPVMCDKNDPDVKLVSPLSGKIESIVRGPRRKILNVIISASDEKTRTTFEVNGDMDAAALKRLLKISGLWAMMRRRPYDIIPQDSDEPRDIFVTGLDTAPLALNLDSMVNGKEADLKAGVAALRKLTKGTIYICVAEGSNIPDIEGAEMRSLPMLHPAGNVGVQIANIDPVNKGESVWTLDIVTLAKIGTLMLTGKIAPEVTVAVTGSEVTAPRVVTTLPGAPLADLLKDNIADDGHNHRVISGNVLTGTPEGLDGFLRYPYRQVTVIPEGDDNAEFMGWASMSPSKMSESRSFPSHFLGRKFAPDARLQGGRRAMIMSGVYDRYIPMDILPEPLLKAIIARDIDRMEALGIYEVAPEDFALAEYADPSKIELQRIVREGLDYMRSEV